MTLSATADKSRRTRRILTIYKGFWRTKNALNELLKADFRRVAEILIAILGEGNPNEMGILKHFHRTLPPVKHRNLRPKRL